MGRPPSVRGVAGSSSYSFLLTARAVPATHRPGGGVEDYISANPKAGGCARGKARRVGKLSAKDKGSNKKDDSKRETKPASIVEKIRGKR